MDRLKILHVGSSMPDDWGGIERYVATLARAQEKAGHEVTVAAPAGSPLALRSVGDLVAVDLRHPWKAVSDYLRHFRTVKYDIVVTHFSPDYRLPAIAARLARVKNLLMTRHVVEPFRGDRARLYRRLYGGFVGVSHAVAGALSVNLPSDRIRGVHGGCEPLTTEDRPRSPGPLQVGSFGRLVHQKGVDVLISARGIASQPWCVQIYGDGPELSRLRQQAEALREISFHGKIDDVSHAMSGVDMVAIPSRWAEAFSIAALEAMSVGRPVVASRVGGVPELFVGRTPGTLYEQGNVKELATILDGYANDSDKLREDGRTALDLYWSTYTPQHMASRVTATYRELIV